MTEGTAEPTKATKVKSRKKSGIPLSGGHDSRHARRGLRCIGTSPMYTLKAIVSGNGGLETMSQDVVLGALSLIIWTLDSSPRSNMSSLP